MEIILIGMIWLVLLITIPIVALNKHRNAVGWTLVAVVFTPLVLIPLLACKPLDPNDRRQSKPMATKVKT